MVEGLNQLESYFHLLELMLLVVLQGQLRVVLPELPLLELVLFQQVLLPQLVFQQVLLGLEQIEGKLLLRGFEFQH